MSRKLSEGALLTICEGGTVDKPILQVLGLKKVAGGSTDRYRIYVSDGKYSNSFSMLATQMNHKLSDGTLDNLAILRVNKYTCNNMQSKKVIILLDIDVLESGSSVCDRIGNPVQLNADGTVGANQNTEPAASAKPTPPAMKRVAPDELDSKPPAKRSPLTSSDNKPRSSILDSKPIVGMDPSQISVIPISALTPYQNKWTIKARVTHKSDIRKWSNSKGEGHLFSFDLLDESGEIRATAFKDQCDKYYNMIEVGKLFYITSCTLKPANKQYSTLNNEYEMTFRDNTEVIPCKEETSSIPSLAFNFVEIGELSNATKDTIVDIIAICKSATDATTIMTKSSKELTKRDISLVDKSNAEINLTLWGSTAETFDAANNPVVAIKGVRVSDYNGVSLSTLSSSVIQINPDLPQSHALKGWFESEGGAMETNCLTQVGKRSEAGMGGNGKVIWEVKAENLGRNGPKADYYTTTAYITMIKKENILYRGCAQENEGKTCNKKVMDNSDGTFSCQKCGKSTENFNWRLILSFSMADMTDNQWATCFQEQGEQLLGMSAEELGTLQTNDPDQFNKIFADATFKKYVFRMSCKEDTYNEESRTRHIVRSLTAVDEKENIKNLVKQIEEHGMALPDNFDKSKYF